MKVKDLAKQVLRQYWDRKIPVDPTAIARSMKATVVADDSLGLLSGMYRLEVGGPTIRFNAAEPILRQRFTIAHELGHYVLGHGDEFRDPTRNFNTDQFNPKESAANQFAAHLLMPEEAIASFIEKRGISDLRTLAARFQVSEVAMKIRLKSLGWTSE
jgi:Zn-dependent peptidase ImmA (M78 family)